MFLKTIDIDTELKCINYKNSLCPREKYLPNTNCNNKLNKLKNPYCQFININMVILKPIKIKIIINRNRDKCFFKVKKYGII